jgi:ABC-type Fe3+ transport system substrate-binding protein
MAEISQRLMAERRAGKYLADLYMSGPELAYEFYRRKILDPVRPLLILPEVLDESKWWSGKHVYHDDESSYIIAVSGTVNDYFARNTKLVNPKEFSSYWDILNPKWEGKVVTLDPTDRGMGAFLNFCYLNPKLGPDFIRRLFSRPDLMASRDKRQIVDWVATGRYLIAVTQPTEPFKAKEQGLPVDNFDTSLFKEGAPISTSSGNVALFTNAPHRNAAKVLINWLLSREGQIAYQTYDPRKDSLREDIPKDMVPDEARRKKGGNYVLNGGPGYMDLGPVNQIVKEVWRRR